MCGGVKWPPNRQCVWILTELQLRRLGQCILGCLSKDKIETSIRILDITT
jgi:hypothetical protein